MHACTYLEEEDGDAEHEEDACGQLRPLEVHHMQSDHHQHHDLARGETPRGSYRSLAS